MDIKEILLDYQQTKSSVKTAEKYNITQKRVLQLLHSNGIIPFNTNTGNSRYTKDENFFSSPNILNSYWAGFIAADGYITQDGAVGISLKNTENFHLEKFKSAINYSGDIKQYCHNTTYAKGYKYCRIQIYSRQMCNNLFEYWRVIPNKTGILKFPKTLSDDILFSYLIGYIDGDGSFILSNGRLQYVQIAGYLDYLKDVIEFLSSYLEDDINAFKTYPDHSIYRLTFSRKNLVNKFRNKFLMFKDVVPYLERKWDRLLEADLTGGRL